ncbi:MAG: hypothetical protein AAF431_19530 [Pseudomonadota bacterium]
MIQKLFVLTGALLPLVLTASTVFGNDYESSSLRGKYGSMEPLELLRLPAHELENEVPQTLVYAAREFAAMKSNLVYKIRLNSLMYSASNDYLQAIKEFQEDLGVAQTGKFTTGQLDELEYRSSINGLGEIEIDTDIVYFKSDSVAKLEGSWMAENGEVNAPIGRVEVQCFKLLQYCELRHIELKVPSRLSLERRFKLQFKKPVFYTIEDWSKKKIVLSGNSNDGCELNSMELNFDGTRNFMETVTYDRINCSDQGRDSKEYPKIFRVVDGGPLLAKEFSKIRREGISYWSSAFRRSISE